MAGTTLHQNGANGNGSILALDLGSKTGWALRQTDGTVTCGTVEFKPSRFEGGGMRFLRFKKWLNEVNGFAVPIGYIAFEEVRSHVGVTAAHVYGGFLAHLSAWAEQHEIPYQGVPVGTIKRHVTGKGNASKAEVIEAMRRKGHHPADDNAADALAILHWVLDEEVVK
jgi:Holliday junction resolvasome RuvABC endonuclease subunit